MSDIAEYIGNLRGRRREAKVGGLWLWLNTF